MKLFRAVVGTFATVVTIPIALAVAGCLIAVWKTVGTSGLGSATQSIADTEVAAGDTEGSCHNTPEDEDKRLVHVGTMAMRSQNNEKYLTFNLEDEICASASVIQDRQKVELHRRKDSTYSAIEYKGKYLSARPDGTIVMQPHVRGWEWFLIETQGKENTVAIKSTHGTYVCWDGEHLVVDRTEPRRWERFDLHFLN